MSDLGLCIAPYCQHDAVVYVFGHANRVTVVRASDSRAALLAQGLTNSGSGGRCLDHMHDAVDDLVEGTFEGGRQ